MRQSRVAARAEDWTTKVPEADEVGRGPSLWDRILGSLQEDLVKRRERKVFVRVPSSAGSYTEIGELTTEQLRRLDCGLHGRVAEQLLDRYLAEGGNVDLLEKRRAYTKKIDNLVPEDLPALIEADRVKAEEHFEERDRARFAADVHRDLEQLGTKGHAAAERELQG
jgi:hypothetical protein